MAILIDAPRWPAHGTHFAHLVSDNSLEELFAFADAAGLPQRAFDHDHYDVPERRYAELVAAGAEPVDEKTLLRRLTASGLRVRPPQRTPRAEQVIAGVQHDWVEVMPDSPELGAELIARWREPHRSYHDVRHLAHALAALSQLDSVGSRAARLAVWFHDAVHTGTAGADERASAELATHHLGRLGLPTAEVDQVADLVLLTIDHLAPPDRLAAAVLDADLAVLGATPGRYHVYARDVRAEYPQYSDQEFAAGRLQVLDRLLDRPQLFHTELGRTRWGEAATTNLASERRRWQQFLGEPRVADPE